MHIDLNIGKPCRRVHFIGIGGIGMSALARVLIAHGFQVSGSDAKQSATTKRLESLGCTVVTGHQSVPEDVDCVVYSTAIRPENAEFKDAVSRGLPLIHRASLLSSVMNGKTSVGIAGTHGKTTTTSMLTFLSQRIGLNPLGVVGGLMANFQDNVYLPAKEPSLIVAEVDESDRSIVNYHPTHAIITNVEEDHLDFYRDIHEIRQAFSAFIKNVSDKGVIICNGDDKNLIELAKSSGKEFLTYGNATHLNYYPENIVLNPLGSVFDLSFEGNTLGHVKLNVPGAHNISNTVAVLAMVQSLGADILLACEIMSEFKGVSRRLEIKYSQNGVIVFDDYAHHPTEIESSLKAIEKVSTKNIVIFQPHRISRTKHFAKAFGKSFKVATKVYLLDIYRAGENEEEGITSDLIARAVSAEGTEVEIIQKENLIEVLKQDAKDKCSIIFMGAGDVTEIASHFAQELEVRNIAR